VKADDSIVADFLLSLAGLSAAGNGDIAHFLL